MNLYDKVETDYKMAQKLCEDMKLTRKQQIAYDHMVANENVFVTGPSGVGKSSVIKMFRELHGNNKVIAMTSTTGISALLVGGTTIHSYLGIGLGKGSVETLVANIMMKQYLRQRWKKLDILIIDEISMLDPGLFDKLEEVARDVRNQVRPQRMMGGAGPPKPFGGIQLILSGDYCQLPVIGSDDFCFEAKSWKKCVPNTVVLTKIIRQTDLDFQKCLNNLRFARITQSTKDLLLSRLGAKLENEAGVKPTRIHTTNVAVDEINERELDLLANDDTEFLQYDMEMYLYQFVKNKNYILERYRKNCMAPSRLQLCVGAQVMLLHNLDMENELANGSRGVVIKFVEDLPVVRFLNGIERIINYHVWEYEEADKPMLKITQMPLKLAWAITIHKCVTGNTIICTENGLQKIRDLSSTNQLHSTSDTIKLSVIGKTGKNTATQIFKGVSEPKITVTTSLGYTVSGSERHPVLTYDGREVWKKLPEIVKGDYLVLKSNTQCFGINPSTSEFKPVDCKICYTIPDFVTVELCYLIGLLIGDGCYSVRRNYPIEFAAHKSETRIIKLFTEYTNNIFGKSFNKYTYSRVTTVKLMKNSKMIREFLLWCGLDYVTSESKVIPWSVMQNTRECQIACLRGLFDTDGGVNTLVHYTTVSHQLAVDISAILLNIGIISSIRKMGGKSREKLRQAYRIHISGYQAHLFYKIVGFESEKKARKLADIYGSYTTYTVKSNICEIPNGKNLISNLRKEVYAFTTLSRTSSNMDISKLSGILSRIINGRSKLRHNHVKFICDTISTNIIPIEELGSYGSALNYIYTNNLFFDRVTSISSGSDEVLYDLYVPDDHTFIGNGIINHNSQGQTLDYAEVDLSNVFTFGQAYVALSRVKSKEGLSIVDIDFDTIRVHPKAKEYYKELKRNGY